MTAKQRGEKCQPYATVNAPYKETYKQAYTIKIFWKKYTRYRKKTRTAYRTEDRTRTKTRGGRRVAWASSDHEKCCGGKGIELVMQDDGNLVLYTADKEPAWYSKQ